VCRQEEMEFEAVLSKRTLKKMKREERKAGEKAEQDRTLAVQRKERHAEAKRQRTEKGASVSYAETARGTGRRRHCAAVAQCLTRKKSSG